MMCHGNSELTEFEVKVTFKGWVRADNEEDAELLITHSLNAVEEIKIGALEVEFKDVTIGWRKI